MVSNVRGSFSVQGSRGLAALNSWVVVAPLVSHDQAIAIPTRDQVYKLQGLDAKIQRERERGERERD